MIINLLFIEIQEIYVKSLEFLHFHFFSFYARVYFLNEFKLGANKSLILKKKKCRSKPENGNRMNVEFGEKSKRRE